jgi:hypothetical protein
MLGKAKLSAPHTGRTSEWGESELSARNRILRFSPGIALAALIVLALAACGSSGHPAAAAKSSQAASTITTTCQQVSAVLSDGPDPDADPVGYAEAQFGPLRQLHVQDAALQDAITGLANAYQKFFSTSGSSTAKEAVAVASSKINSICPGAAS